MIKAVFFDWFNTLARYQPPREDLYRSALSEFGIDISSQILLPAVLAADDFFFEENARLSLERRDPKEQAEVFLRYQSIVLNRAGVKAEQELLLKLMKRMQQLFAEVSFALFDDVLPTLKTLKERKLVLGLLTNSTRNMLTVHDELGLKPYLNFVITSEEVGKDKPEPPIFLAALERSGVKAAEAAHVGDQYKLDVVGARRVGIRPVLIDRYNLHPEYRDCPRINSLTELSQHLSA